MYYIKSFNSKEDVFNLHLYVGFLSENNSNTSSDELGNSPQQKRRRTRRPYTRWSREATDTIHSYFESFLNTDKNPGMFFISPIPSLTISKNVTVAETMVFVSIE